MKETKYIFIYPTIEVRINLTYLFEKVCDTIRLGINEGELDEENFDDDEIDDVIEDYCYDTIYDFVESEIEGTIDELELGGVHRELSKMIATNVDEFKKFCKK